MMTSVFPDEIVKTTTYLSTLNDLKDVTLMVKDNWGRYLEVQPSLRDKILLSWEKIYECYQILEQIKRYDFLHDFRTDEECAILAWAQVLRDCETVYWRSVTKVFYGLRVLV